MANTPIKSQMPTAQRSAEANMGNTPIKPQAPTTKAPESTTKEN